MIAGITKIHGDYKTTIPKRVRELINIKKGDVLVWVYEDKKITIMKSNEEGG